MRKRILLNIFDEPAGTAAGNDPAPAGTQSAQQQAAPAGTYSFAQAEEIATARAQKAERSALASYFRQQNLSEEQVTEAIAAYKAAQKAKAPDVATLQKERDEALRKAESYERREELAKKGVKPEFAAFVTYEVAELMKSDEKLDTFAKAADKYLKDNPQYTGGAAAAKGSYRVKTSAASGSGDGGGSGKDAKAQAHAALNAALKARATRRK